MKQKKPSSLVRRARSAASAVSPAKAPSTPSKQKSAPFFDESKMGAPTDAYVGWVDVMGSGSTMRRSVRVTANFVMKLHVAALEEAPDFPDVELVPMIDGIYLVSGQQANLLGLLKSIMKRLAPTFIAETNPIKRFMVRAAVAYGPICDGKDIEPGSPVLAANPDYCRSVLLGIPVIQAYSDESNASPYGVYIHESARSFAPDDQGVLPHTHWEWWRALGAENKSQGKEDKKLATELGRSLLKHYAWCREHATTILYPEKAISKHESLVKEYFDL